MRTELRTGLLPVAAAEDAGLTSSLANLINHVYLVAEDGLWLGDVARTDDAEVATLIRTGELGVARLAGEIVGCVRVRRLEPELGEFGMLAADPGHRGAGIGRELVALAESHARAVGCRGMQLELLVPQEWTHPTKKFLADWYDRLGYRVLRVDSPEQALPHVADKLATPCDFLIYRKDLTARS